MTERNLPGISFTWMGVRKTLTPEQKNQAAESFGAEGDSLSACKKLLDTKHAAYKEVTAVRGRVGAYWKGLTLPYPEPGIRLIRQFHHRRGERLGLHHMHRLRAPLPDHQSEN